MGVTTLRLLCPPFHLNPLRPPPFSRHPRQPSSSSGGGPSTFSGVGGRSSSPSGSDSDDEDGGAYIGPDAFDRAPSLPWPAYLKGRCVSAFGALYGDTPFPEIVRILHLSATLFFMIGGYWLLRSLKDPVLAAICGGERKGDKRRDK